MFQVDAVVDVRPYFSLRTVVGGVPENEDVDDNIILLFDFRASSVFSERVTCTVPIYIPSLCNIII